MLDDRRVGACCMDTEFKKPSDMIRKETGESITDRDQHRESSASLGC